MMRVDTPRSSYIHDRKDTNKHYELLSPDMLQQHAHDKDKACLKERHSFSLPDWHARRLT